MELHEEFPPDASVQSSRDCPFCGHKLFYYQSVAYDSRLVCENPECTFWGLP